MTAVIRVMLVDDQLLVRSGIRGLLELADDIRVVAEAANGDEALALLAGTAADVLLLDVRMPGCSGIDVLLRAQAQALPLPPAILLTTFDDDAALLDGMRAGARGFLLKDISLERLVDGIRSVASGATLFRPGLTERTRECFETGMAGAAAAAGNRLTARETEILALMAAGFNNGEIAGALGPSEGTIKNHVSSILAKLGVRDRVRAVLRGLELGYI
jgi:DNA-binding NarL/FixJ family response regulator